MIEIKHNIELQGFNSFKTKSIAKLFCSPNSVEELKKVLEDYPDEKKLIIGEGNNMFFTTNFEGLVIKPNMKGISIKNETENFVEIEVMAAENWDNFVAYCVDNKYSGIENLSLIPGSVGAAPVQNIGAYGTELQDVVLSVEAVDMQTATIRKFNSNECNFEYRNSVFKREKKYIITSVVFRLSKHFEYKDKYSSLHYALRDISLPTLAQVRQAVIDIRNSKLPNPEILPNAGSFFKNPIIDGKTKENLLKKLPNIPIYDLKNGNFKTSAAFLIEKIGYRGKRVGMIGVYDKHSLIIVNHGSSKGIDIVIFMKKIQDEIFRNFNIKLEPEVQIY